MRNSIIAGTGSYVPDNIVSNDDLSKIMDTNDEWISSRTGIKNRCISIEENTSDLAYEAGLKAIKNAGMIAEDIDLIIVSTITPDMQMPSVSCMVQKKLGAVNASAFDVSAACSGFIYAVDIADSMIRCGRHNNVLVIGAEVLSKSVNWSDRSTAVLFGDGAGAAVLKADDNKKGILYALTAAEGDKGQYLEMEEKPVISPFSNNKGTNINKFITMDGKQVLRFSTRVIVDAVKEVLEKTDESIDDIAYIIPHQANYRIIDYAAHKLNVDCSKFYLNIRDYGNTSSASIAIALDEAFRKNKVKKGDKVILVGFGGGLTYGAILVEI